MFFEPIGKLGYWSQQLTWNLRKDSCVLRGMRSEYRLMDSRQWKKRVKSSANVFLKFLAINGQMCASMRV